MIAFLFGLGTAFDNPARQSFVYELVGPERLPNAIGLNSATFHAARIVGPALAGFVIAGFGTGWAILSNAVTYLAFIAALRLLDPGGARSSPGWSAAADQIREGFAYVRRHRQILLALGVALFVGTFGMNFQLTSALMAQQEFGLGARAVRPARHLRGRRVADRRAARRPAYEGPQRPVRGRHGPGLRRHRGASPG